MNDDEKARDVIQKLAAQYEGWAQGDLTRLRAAYTQACSLSGGARGELIRDDLFRAAHDIKGQGATFDYDLMTDIANHLCRYIEEQACFNDAQMAHIQTHIDALAQVLDNHLTHDGGTQGQALLSRIKEIH